MSITLNELIEELQDYLADYPELGDEAVNIAYQRNYPLAAEIVRVTVLDSESLSRSGDADDYDDCECESLNDCTHQVAPTLWLATTENDSEPYAPKAAWRQG